MRDRGPRDADRAQSDGASIVSVCVEGFPGTNRALGVLAKVTGLARHFVLGADAGARHVRLLRAHLAATRPRTVVLGGWSARYEPLLTARATHGSQFLVYWTSSAGQTDMTGELDTWLRVVGDRRIGGVLYADRTLARSAAAGLKAAAWLPICASLPARPRARVRVRRRRRPVVSLFFASTEARRKNPMNVLLALAGLDIDYVVHLNGLSRHDPYRTLLRDLGIPFRDLGWMSRAAYERALEDVDLGLQVSFAESYSQVAADHVLRGIPVVVSEMVPAVRNVDGGLRRRVVVANADDSRAIGSTIRFLLTHPQMRRRVATAMRRQLMIDNAANVATAVRVLRGLA